MEERDELCLKELSFLAADMRVVSLLNSTHLSVYMHIERIYKYIHIHIPIHTYRERGRDDYVYIYINIWVSIGKTISMCMCVCVVIDICIYTALQLVGKEI